MPANAITFGAHSQCLRRFDLEGVVEQLNDFDVNTIEFSDIHLPPDADDPGFSNAKAIIEKAGLQTPSYGVVAFQPDEAEARKVFRFVQALGAGIITADPDPEALDMLEALSGEYTVRVAIVNGAPGGRYLGAEGLQRALEGRGASVGACVHTGHAVRGGEAPAAMIRALGDRVLSVHLQDWDMAANEESLVGEGAVDIHAVAAALREAAFTGPVILRTSMSQEFPVPDMAIGRENWKDALES